MGRQRKDKIDKNQNDIVKTLRAIKGVAVDVGHDDILVGYKGNNFWFEIKTPDCVSKQTGLILESAKKDSQKRLEKEWRGHYRIVSNVDEILSDIGLL
jgi:hypothetical protein